MRSLSTTAVRRSSVIGIPIRAYTMQNDLPSADSGDWWP
jgi:hypothetical protein